MEEKEIREENLEESNKDSEPVSHRRSNLLWLIAGAYLAYTGYNLFQGFLKGQEGSSLLFGLSGLAFLVLGGFLAIKGFLNESKDEKKRREWEAAQAAKEEEEASQAGQDPSPQPKSIAERARLAQALGDVEVSSQDDREEAREDA